MYSERNQSQESILHDPIYIKSSTINQLKRHIGTFWDDRNVLQIYLHIPQLGEYIFGHYPFKMCSF